MSPPAIEAHRQQVEVWNTLDKLVMDLASIRSSAHFTLEDLQIMHKAGVHLIDLRNRMMVKIQAVPVEQT